MNELIIENKIKALQAKGKWTKHKKKKKTPSSSNLSLYISVITSNGWSWPGMSKQLCENVPNNTLPKCSTVRNLIRDFLNETIKRCQEISINNCFESGDNLFPSMGDCIQYCRPSEYFFIIRWNKKKYSKYLNSWKRSGVMCRQLSWKRT